MQGRNKRCESKYRERGSRLVEGADSGKAEHGLGGAEEELKNRHGGCQLARCHLRHVADGARSLEDDHLSLVPQASLQEVVEGPLLVSCRRCGFADDLRHIPVSPPPIQEPLVRD